MATSESVIPENASFGVVVSTVELSLADEPMRNMYEWYENLGNAASDGIAAATQIATSTISFLAFIFGLSF